MKLHIHLPPLTLTTPREQAAYQDACTLARTHWQDATGETFLIELHDLYLFRSALRAMNSAATDYGIELSPHPDTYRKRTSRALTRRIALMLEALLFLQDAHDTLQHFDNAESIYQVTIEALLALLQATQQHQSLDRTQQPGTEEETPECIR